MEPAPTEPQYPGHALRGALVAGLVAGAALGVFHLLFTEPVIDAAIALEELAHGGEEEALPVVPRELQRVGLVAGFLIYGLSVALLFYGAFVLAQRLLPFKTLARKGLALAGLAYWSLALAPFLKYPANPPGVGEPETIQYRQLISLGFMALVLLGVALSLWLFRRFNPAGALRQAQDSAPAHRPGLPTGQAGLPWWALVIGNLLYVALLYFVMPANPDPVAMPEELVLQFRWISLAGLTLFWASFGGLMGFFLRGLRGDTRVVSEGLASF